MEEEFFATIKLKTGEELFSKVAATEEENGLFLVLLNPMVVFNNLYFGILLEPWLKTTSQTMFIIDLNDVITMTECNDIEMLRFYTTFVRKTNNIKEGNSTHLTKEMGYIGNVNDMKEILEKLYEKDRTELSD